MMSMARVVAQVWPWRQPPPDGACLPSGVSSQGSALLDDSRQSIEANHRFGDPRLTREIS